MEPLSGYRGMLSAPPAGMVPFWELQMRAIYIAASCSLLSFSTYKAFVFLATVWSIACIAEPGNPSLHGL